MTLLVLTWAECRCPSTTVGPEEEEEDDEVVDGYRTAFSPFLAFLGGDLEYSQTSGDVEQHAISYCCMSAGLDRGDDVCRVEGDISSPGNCSQTLMYWEFVLTPRFLRT